MNFDQFLSGVLATIIGFGLTLFGQAVYDWLKDRSSARQCIKSLINELTSIENKIQTIDALNASGEPA